MFADKVALVTGAGSGIGKASALAFAREGARVVVSDVAAEGGEETVRLIRESGGTAAFVRADVAKSADVQALVSTTIELFGRLDYAHNNAGVEGSRADILDEEDFDRTININLRGVFLCLKYEIAQMIKQGGGAIVNTASVAGLVGLAGSNPAYIASKHGVVGLTKWAALTYARQGIRVNAVCPGSTLTPMVTRVASVNPGKDVELVSLQPIGRVGRPEEVAAAVVWLCSDNSSFVLGEAMAVDGGWTAQ